jgi:hypothetical protein
MSTSVWRILGVGVAAVLGLGDVYSPKDASLTVDQRYQNVRIVAVYQTDQVPVLPPAPKS